MSKLIQSVIPGELEPEMLTSASDAITSRRLVEILPEGLTTYSYSTNKFIRFTLNSADSFLDGENSYLRFGVTTTLTNATANSQTQLREAAKLDVGGAHSFIKGLTIRANGGTVLSECRDYNKLYSLIRQYSMPKSHVDLFGAAQGDSWEGYASYAEQLVPLSFQTLAYDSSGGASESLVTLVGGNAVNELAVGDIIIVQATPTAVGNRMDSHHVVIAITDANNFVVTGSGPAASDLAAAAVGRVFVQKFNRAPRNRVAITQATSIVLDLQLLNNFLLHSQYIPLMFIKNLQIELELENPNMCFVTPRQDAQVMDYTISTPRFICSMVQPAEALKKKYLDMYNNEGIPYKFMDFMHNLKSLSAAAAQSVDIPCNARSVRAIISGKYYSNSEVVNANYTPAYPSVSSAVKSGATYYQYKIGSESFPSFGRANCSGIANGENLQLTLSAMGVSGEIGAAGSLKPSHYLAQNNLGPVDGAGTYIASESLGFVMAVKTDKAGAFSGVDLSTNTLQLEFDDTGTQSLYLHTWIAHDRLVVSSKDQGVRVLY
jgi:hypothetical protein